MLKKKLSFKTCCLAIVALGLTACQQVSSTATAQPNQTTEAVNKMDTKEAEIVAKLEWVKTANAEADARNALTMADSEKIEIIGFSGRGISFPGLTKSQYSEIENRVTYRLTKGTGDTIYGPTQKALRKELRAYVSTYNTIIYDALTDTK